MNCSLNSVKGVTSRIIWGTTIGAIKGDTRSSDCSLYGALALMALETQRLIVSRMCVQGLLLFAYA